ncbi:MAG TPA: cbb3-type cytochrome c oxidase subunit I [Verrucomicrobiae bacterium]|nr:cbb3-type cytochrome c oxidase subunit I [Verrucomicrobiae bacterium]
MNENEHSEISGGASVPASRIDASCRVPLLALFGGAALWLIVGLLLALIASLTFHMPEKFGNCAWFTYGRLQPAANDAIVYGFCIPAALGVILWIFARLSETELFLPLVPIIAANIWHLGVFVGIVGILIGDSTGFQWLEFPRGGSVLLFAAFVLIAISAVATFGARRNRELQPAHWFLLAALFWFPWIYSTVNLFLVAWPVRGVAQAVIAWWFANNLLFIWFALVGLGIAFYFLPKFSGKSLPNYFALFAFWTLMLFGTWLGIPQGAPVPAWLPALSFVGSLLTILPLIAIAVVYGKTVCGANVQCKGGPFCYIKFGTVAFLLSSVLLLATGCSHFSRVVGFTWFTSAQTQLQIFGFFAIVICGAIYELLPRVMDFELPFPKFVRLQHWLFMLGVALLVVSLAVGGIKQGLNNFDFQTQLPFLRVSTMGILLLLLGSLLLAANIFVMTLKWKLALLKSLLTAVKAPLETAEVKS